MSNEVSEVDIIINDREAKVIGGFCILFPQLINCWDFFSKDDDPDHIKKINEFCKIYFKVDEFNILDYATDN